MSLVKAAVLVVSAGLVVLACSGGQGDTCTTDTDCGANLTCQPIVGRTKLFCCPTPAEASDYQNCHADVAAAAAHPSSSSSGAADAASGG